MLSVDKKSRLENIQKIYFDSSGTIAHSCDGIFEIRDFLNQNIRDCFPLIDSIFEHLLSLKTSDSSLQIQKIKTTFPKLKGFYDFLFDKVFFENRELILLTIKDFTKFYSFQQEQLQKHNEGILKKTQ